MKYADMVGEKRETLDYLIDGVVFKVDDVSLRDEIGFTENFRNGRSHTSSRRTR